MLKRTIIVIDLLLIITVLISAGVGILSSTRYMLEQATDDGRMLTEQFARAIAVGEEIQQELEAIYAQRQQSQAAVMPLVLSMARATGQSPEQIIATLRQASGEAALAEFAARRMGPDVWLGQFADNLISNNVNALWVLSPALELRLYKALPGSGVPDTLDAPTRAILQQAADTHTLHTYYDGTFLNVAAPVVNAQGHISGVTMVVFPTTRTRVAMLQQIGLLSLAALILLGVGVGVSVIFARRVTQPILQLTQAAAAVESGAPPNSLTAVTTRTDELGHLGRVFETMARQVLARDQRLRLLRVVIPIGISLSAEKDFDRLLETIVREAQELCHADAGSLYLHTDDEKLQFVIVRNNTLGLEMGGTTKQVVTFPAVRLYDDSGQPNYRQVAAYAALTHTRINIPDAYQAEGFDFSGTRAFDACTGYHSTSLLAIPLEGDDQRVIGVLQLINATDPQTGKTVPFAPDEAMESLIALAAAALTAYIRQDRLKQEIARLRIEIDTAKQARQVAEITETDYFQQLQKRAKELRRRAEPPV